jgi:hypothetical protein
MLNSLGTLVIFSRVFLAKAITRHFTVYQGLGQDYAEASSGNAATRSRVSAG